MVIWSRNVEFDEQQTRDWKDEKHKQVIIEESKEESLTQVHGHTEAGESSNLETQKTRKIQDIYNTTPRIEAENEFGMFCLFASYNLLTFEEAYQEETWRKAMKEEIQSIYKNKTWEFATLPKGHKAIDVKWVYKTKRNAQGQIEKHKARLVVKGYKQKYGVDYDEVFAPVTRLDTVGLIISVATQIKWRIFQMDVKSAFLNGFLKEEVYIKQPPGFSKKG